MTAECTITETVWAVLLVVQHSSLLKASLPALSKAELRVGEATEATMCAILVLPVAKPPGVSSRAPIAWRARLALLGWGSCYLSCEESLSAPREAFLIAMARLVWARLIEALRDHVHKRYSTGKLYL